MSLITYQNIKKLFFKLNPETAHSVAGFGLRAVQYCPSAMRYFKNRYFVSHPMLEQKIFDRVFHNPVGLGAGFDKNAQYIIAMPTLGFGFTEVGTITPKPQSGNAKPRLFRLIEDRSIQNAMGFNNYGAYYALQQLKKLYFFDYPVGINIGKNKTTPEIEALNDYEHLFRAFKDYGDYMVINISSPNTPGLRDLQNESFIKAVFDIGKSITTKPILFNDFFFHFEQIYRVSQSSILLKLTLGSFDRPEQKYIWIDDSMSYYFGSPPVKTVINYKTHLKIKEYLNV